MLWKPNSANACPDILLVFFKLLIFLQVYVIEWNYFFVSVIGITLKTKYTILSMPLLYNLEIV